MAKNKPNPSFSPTIQALLDLKECGFEVDSLIKEIEKDEVNRKKADKLFDEHQYPDKSLKYTQYFNFNECRADMELSAQALKILILFIKDMPENGLVSISREYIGKITHLSPKTIRKAINELLDNGFIALMYEPTNKHAPIYMINPDIANTGKPVSEIQKETFKDLVLKSTKDGLPLFKFTNMNKLMDNIAIENCKYIDPLDKTVIKYNSYREIGDKEKGSPVTTTDKPQNDKLPF